MSTVAKRSPISATAELLLHSSRQSVAILYNEPLRFPLKIAPFYGDLNPHLIHGSLDAPESLTQTASRSVEPFLLGSVTILTDRQTDRPRYSVCNNRPHLRTYSTAVQPNINLICNAHDVQEMLNRRRGQSPDGQIDGLSGQLTKEGRNHALQPAVVCRPPQISDSWHMHP